MPIDIAMLAATVISTYLLPFLKDGAKSLGEELSKKLGENAAKHVTEAAPKIWERVKKAFSDNDEIITLGLFEKSPEVYEEPVKKILQRKLQDDDQLSQELNQMVRGPEEKGQSIGAQITDAVNAGIVDLRGATISGSNNVITGAVFNQPGPVDPPKKGS